MTIATHLLQKLFRSLKSKGHLIALERRIKLWASEELLDLLKGNIQKSVEPNNKPSSIAEIFKTFSKGMKKGKV